MLQACALPSSDLYSRAKNCGPPAAFQSRREVNMTTRSFCVVTILGLMIGAAAGARPGLDAQGGTAAQSPTCIAVPLPSMTGVPGRVEDVGNGVRDLFATYLTAPAFKIVPLDARLPALALDEARQKGCENVLI